MNHPREEIKTRLLGWWNNRDQDGPILLGTVYRGEEPEIPDIAAYWGSNDIRFARFRARQKTATYFGCAAAYHYVDFGSSAMAGALGCRMNPLTFDTIWPSRLYETLPAADAIRLQTDGGWYRMLYDMIERSAADESFSTTFYALGGVGDTLGSLCGEQTLLLAMYDDPAGVHACLDRLCDIWIAEKEKQWGILRGRQDGMASWAGIWAPGSTFPVQEDLSYMLGPDDFREFCLPRIRRCIDSLDYPLYHLDGPAAIRHLDSLLTIDRLRAIQWVPGAGHTALAQWHPLIRRILDSGRSVQVFCRTCEVAPLVEAVGLRGLLCTISDATYENSILLQQYL